MEEDEAMFFHDEYDHLSKRNILDELRRRRTAHKLFIDSNLSH